MTTKTYRIGVAVAVAAVAGVWTGGIGAATAASAAMPEVVDVRPGDRVPFAGGGCLFDGGAGEHVGFELRGAPGGPRALTITSADGAYTVSPDDEGLWRAVVRVPYGVAPGAYPVVPVCIAALPSRQVDLPGGVKVLRVLRDASTPTRPHPAPAHPVAPHPLAPPEETTTVRPAPVAPAHPAEPRPAALRVTPRYTG